MWVDWTLCKISWRWKNAISSFEKIPFCCVVCEVSFVSKDLLLEHKAVAHGLTQRRKRDGKLKMKTA